MERITFGLLFYIRRTKLNKSGEASIFCVLRSMVSVRTLRSNVPSNPFMDTAKGKAVENGRGCKDLNLYLDVISANIFRIQRDIELEGLEFPLMLSLIATWENRPERHTLVEVFVEHNEKQKKLSG